MFQPMNFFMMRMPLLPVDLYVKLFGEEENPEEIIAKLILAARDPQVHEAIGVASLSLLESLPNIEQGDARKRQQALKGFLRYLIRMITRTTPFGLCSGVAYGVYGEKALVKVPDRSAHRKRTRPDMEWLMHVLQELESSPEVLKQLKVQMNPMLYKIGARYFLPYVTRFGLYAEQNKMKIENSSIGVTAVTEAAMELAKEPVLFSELVRGLQERFAGTAVEEVERFLHKLCAEEFLTTELRVPLTNTSPFDYVLDKLAPLSGIESMQQQLYAVREQIMTYDQLAVGTGDCAL